jgi:hypothetical protein
MSVRPPISLVLASTFLLLLSAGAGSAVAEPLFLSAPSFEVPSSPLTLALGDLNKDGKGDLALVNGSAQAVTVYLSAGDGTFQVGVSYSTGSGPYLVLIGDVNGDGNPDLITGNAGTVSVLLGNGDGTFTTHVDYAMSGAGLAAGDVNGDGRLDVATSTSILLGNGNGTFQAKTDYAAGNTFPLVAIGDLNGDGNADIVTAGAGAFSVFLSHGDGTFAARADHLMGTPAAAFRRPIEAMSPRSRDSAAYYGNNEWMTLADASGDGRLDLLFVGSNGGQFLSTVTLQLGRGDGTFEARVDYATEDYPSYVAVGDVSGDGKPDIVTAND